MKIFPRILILAGTPFCFSSLLRRVQSNNIVLLDLVFTMAEYFKYLKQMLSIAGESFEDKLKHLGLSVTQLNPMEVLSALLHAHKCLGHEFTKEEFKSRTVGSFMVPEDFKPKESVSITNSCLLTCSNDLSRHLFHDPVMNIQQIIQLLTAVWKNTCFQELHTLSPIFPRGFFWTHYCALVIPCYSGVSQKS